jgi:hypothetical protein
MYGFRNLEEKQKVEKIAWAKYYEIMEQQMQVGSNITVQKHRDRLMSCLHYQVPPEYSTGSWLAMLFSAAMGCGLVFLFYLAFF